MRAIWENIHGGTTIITKKRRRDLQKHFKYIFGGDQGLILEKNGSKKRTVRLRQMLPVLIKKSVYR